MAPKPHFRFFPVILVFVATLLVYLVLPIVLLLLVVPVLVYRWVIAKLYSWRHTTASCGILGGQSAFFYEMNDDCVLTNQGKPTILLTVTVQGATADIDAFRALFAREILSVTDSGRLLYPEFQQYPELWMGYLFWRRDLRFKIENHLKVYQNIENWGMRDTAFCERFIHEYRKAELLTNRSPWEVTVIENVQMLEKEEAVTLLVFKVPHYFADGYSLFNALSRLQDGRAEVKPKRYEPKPFTAAQRFRFAVKYPFVGPFEYIASAVTSAAKTVSFDQSLPKPKQPKALTIDTIEDGLLAAVNRSLCASTKSLSLDTLRWNAKVNKVSFTSALLSCIGRGTRKHFQHSRKSIPPYMTSALPLPAPSHASGLTNDLYLATVHIPMQDSPLEDQLWELEHELRCLKRSTVPVTNALLMSLVGCFPATWTWKNALVARFSGFHNLMGVFPGPSSEFKILGRRVLGMNYTAVPGSRESALTLDLITYNGVLQFWITAPDDLVPPSQLKNLVNCIEQEFTKQHE